MLLPQIKPIKHILVIIYFRNTRQFYSYLNREIPWNIWIYIQLTYDTMTQVNIYYYVAQYVAQWSMASLVILSNSYQHSVVRGLYLWPFISPSPCDYTEEYVNCIYMSDSVAAPDRQYCSWHWIPCRFDQYMNEHFRHSLDKAGGNMPLDYISYDGL